MAPIRTLPPSISRLPSAPTTTRAAERAQVPGSGSATAEVSSNRLTDVFESSGRRVADAAKKAAVPGGPRGQAFEAEPVTVSAKITPKLFIPDQTAAVSTLAIDQDVEVGQLALDLDIRHSYRGDLVVTLVSPAGTRAVVSDRNGGSADDLKGRFDLGAFAGESARGEWQLIVEDKSRLDQGTLVSWGLDIVGRGATDPTGPTDPTDPTGPTDPVDPPSTRDPRFEGLTDDALKKKIGDVSQKKTNVSYDAARKAIFGDLDNVDGWVTCVYTGRELRTNKVPSANDMNTEHTWPQSKGATGAAKSDLHHLYPTDSKANSVRGSYPFGNVVGQVKWEDPNTGAKLGKGADGGWVFEVPDAHKGNVARSLFYFSAVYNKPISAQEEAAMKSWNMLDPVDAAEIARNDGIERYQRNRNPFVDDASLANDIANF